MIRALIAGRTRVHREALAVALSQARGVRELGTASHREEILTRLAEAPPDIVLVDFVMPEAASIVAEIRRRTRGAGKLYCPPRVVFTLLRRVGAIALGKDRNKKEEEDEHSPIHALTDRERQILQ